MRIKDAGRARGYCALALHRANLDVAAQRELWPTSNMTSAYRLTPSLYRACFVSALATAFIFHFVGPPPVLGPLRTAPYLIAQYVLPVLLMALAIYYRTLEIRLDDGGLTVNSAFRKAFTPLSDIGTLKIKAISHGR